MNFKSNLLREIKRYYQSELAVIYGHEEAGSLLNLLLSHFFGLSRVDMSLKPEYRLSETEILKLHFAVKELKREKPVQYIIGETDFFGLRMKVTPDVLIPRPETEELVEMIVKDNSEKKKLEILDIGTGSGCIALALKKTLTTSKVTAVDVSLSALKVAVENKTLNKLDIDTKQLDILEKDQWNRLDGFDLIVSNPPYVTESDKKLMQKNVTEFEPYLALFVSDDDPLLFYRAITIFARNHLNPGGSLWFEINENLGGEICDLLDERKFIDINRHKDLYGKERFVSAIFV